MTDKKTPKVVEVPRGAAPVINLDDVGGLLGVGDDMLHFAAGGRVVVVELWRWKRLLETAPVITWAHGEREN